MGTTKLVASCVAAAVVGIATASFHDIRAYAEGSDAIQRQQRAIRSALADRRWPKPKPGTWRLSMVKSGDDMPPVIDRVETKDKVAFITIDDGWVHDPDFVNIVRKRHVPIMVFLTDQAARTDYPYFWALQHAGAAIEDHTMDHAAPYNDLRRLSADAQKRQICDSAAIYAEQYGSRPQILRPPGGTYDAVTRRVARDCGIKSIIVWSVEFRNGIGGQLERSDGGTGLRPGDIILMHFREGLATDFTHLLTWIHQAGLRPAALQNYLPASLGGQAPG